MHECVLMIVLKWTVYINESVTYHFSYPNYVFPWIRYGKKVRMK
jgi:hypothetical protein